MTEHGQRYILWITINQKPQTTLQNKESTVQNYRKMSNQNSKKSPGIDCALFNCAEKNDNFGCLNSSLSLFYFYFVTNLRKKIWRTCSYSWSSHSHHTSQCALSWTTPPPSPSVRTLWMTPKWLKSKNNEVITLVFLIDSFVTKNMDQNFCSILRKYVTSSFKYTNNFLNGPWLTFEIF